MNRYINFVRSVSRVASGASTEESWRAALAAGASAARPRQSPRLNRTPRSARRPCRCQLRSGHAASRRQSPIPSSPPSSPTSRFGRRFQVHAGRAPRAARRRSASRSARAVPIGNRPRRRSGVGRRRLGDRRSDSGQLQSWPGRRLAAVRRYRRCRQGQATPIRRLAGARARWSASVTRSTTLYGRVAASAERGDGPCAALRCAARQCLARRRRRLLADAQHRA